MSYKLEKNEQYTEIKRADFVAEYNHRMGLRIEETNDAIYALEKNEIMFEGEPIINPNYEEEMAQARKKKFEEDFFETSLGWIRRSVNMKNGSKKDFLSDLLMQIKAGLEMGVDVKIITYNQPDFYQDETEEYMETLQDKKSATPEFVAECLNRTVLDFGS